MTQITATARNYTATLDYATNEVSIRDAHGVSIGKGRWTGYAIDCDAMLGGDFDDTEEIYGRLDRKIALAIADLTVKR